MVERNERGQIIESVTPDDVLELFEEIEGPVLSSGDVAEHFDVTTETARAKLNALAERRDVDHRRVGRTKVYWRI